MQQPDRIGYVPAERDSRQGRLLGDGVVHVHAESLEDLERVEASLVLFADALPGNVCSQVLGRTKGWPSRVDRRPQPPSFRDLLAQLQVRRVAEHAAHGCHAVGEEQEQDPVDLFGRGVSAGQVCVHLGEAGNEELAAPIHD